MTERNSKKWATTKSEREKNPFHRCVFCLTSWANEMKTTHRSNRFAVCFCPYDRSYMYVCPSVWVDQFASIFGRFNLVFIAKELWRIFGGFFFYVFFLTNCDFCSFERIFPIALFFFFVSVAWRFDIFGLIKIGFKIKPDSKLNLCVFRCCCCKINTFMHEIWSTMKAISHSSLVGVRPKLHHNSCVQIEFSLFYECKVAHNRIIIAVSSSCIINLMLIANDTNWRENNKVKI